MPRAWMGGSTILTAAGRAADCGARMATARPGSRKAAKAPCHAPCTSSFGPIRWRTEKRNSAFACRSSCNGLCKHRCDGFFVSNIDDVSRIDRIPFYRSRICPVKLHHDGLELVLLAAFVAGRDQAGQLNAPEFWELGQRCGNNRPHDGTELTLQVALPRDEWIEPEL